MVHVGLRTACVATAALLVAALLPGPALGTVVVDEFPVVAPPNSSFGHPVVSGELVGAEGIFRTEQPIFYSWALTAYAADTGELVWSRGVGEVGMMDFAGEWVAYRTGGMLERVRIHNRTTNQDITLATDDYGMSLREVTLDGDTAVFLENVDGATYLKSVALPSGEVATETALAGASELAFEAPHVIYVTNRDGTKDLRAYNLESGDDRAFAGGAGEQTQPDLDGSLVVWSDTRDGDSDVYAMSLVGAVELPVATGSQPQSDPRIHGSVVTWTQGDTATESDVYLKDLSTGVTGPVTERAGSQYGADVGEGVVAYQDWDAGVSRPQLMIAHTSVTYPVLGRVSPLRARVGKPHRLSAPLSNEDAEDTHTLTWDWGDGTSTEQKTGGAGRVTASHTYGATGSYAGTLTATDLSGASVERRFTVVVR